MKPKKNKPSPKHKRPAKARAADHRHDRRYERKVINTAMRFRDWTLIDV